MEHDWACDGWLSDWVSLGALASWVPRDELEDAVEVAGKTSRRRGGKLPPQVMVYFVMGLALWRVRSWGTGGR